jgi:lipopolysaccharide transport system ATP-binding protein
MSKVLEVKNISKSFKDYSSEFKRILSWFGLNFKHNVKHSILEDINFSLSKGESIGIVGQNGAGKSTLLKIITGTLKPTTGSVTVNGKIAALLELGMGFHPELTGRQNAYNSAGLMGYTQKEIDKVIGEIESFAEVGEYFDQPVRLYSSGMQVRVAFSVATVFHPDILIIDEALSVGDAYFQHKCFDRIKKFAQNGTSMLFVSHDESAIKNICEKAILLKKGNIKYIGTPENVLNYYNADYENNNVDISTLSKGTRSGNSSLIIENVELYNEEKEKSKSFLSNSKIDIVVNIKVNDDIGNFTVGIAIKDKVGNLMFGTNTELLKYELTTKFNNNLKIKFSIPNLYLGEGNYSITVALHDPNSHVVSNYDWWDRAVMFEVLSPKKIISIGCCSFPISVDLI